eukprot:s756_g12.t1
MEGPVPTGTRLNKKDKSESEHGNDSDEMSDVGGFSDMDEDSAEDRPKIPIIQVLSDGRSVLMDYQSNKQLLLPGKHEWKIGERKGNHTLECISSGANIPTRYVNKALESSKVTEIGATLAAETKEPPTTPSKSAKTAAPATPMSESRRGRVTKKDTEKETVPEKHDKMKNTTKASKTSAVSKEKEKDKDKEKDKTTAASTPKDKEEDKTAAAANDKADKEMIDKSAESTKASSGKDHGNIDDDGESMNVDSKDSDCESPIKEAVDIA